MTSLAIAGIVLACTCGGAVVGLLLRSLLPQHHLGNEARDVVKLGSGVIATMAALVIGLLIASAKSDFDTQKNAFQQISTNIVLLDRALEHYGSKANTARAKLRSFASSLLEHVSIAQGVSSGIADQEITAYGGALYDSLRDLPAGTDAQRAMQTQTLQIAADLARARLPLTLQQSGLPVPFLVVLVFWLTILFLCFGLLAPANATVLGVLFVCALSVAGALFLIVDLDRPFDGLIRISPDSLRSAVAQLGQ